MEEGEGKIPLVADSNILFRFLLKSSRIRELLYSGKILVYVPDWAVYEIEKYLERLRAKLARKGFSPTLLEYLKVELFGIVIIVPKRFFHEKIPEALSIASGFDEKDTPFIALALKLRIPLWTEDRDMLKHAFLSGRYIALDTKAVEEILKGEKLEDVLERLRERLR